MGTGRARHLSTQAEALSETLPRRLRADATPLVVRRILLLLPTLPPLPPPRRSAFTAHLGGHPHLRLHPASAFALSPQASPQASCPGGPGAGGGRTGLGSRVGAPPAWLAAGQLEAVAGMRPLSTCTREVGASVDGYKARLAEGS